ncbi:uncharacterized protein BDR25DRAFT_357169 [Lindgomyces ingoldianus]|uniref:Uncharacterized protein n=1 Tax=Lindgomyces ingoldianus TaxID=673940 RepID=A0ACB6QR90_9PLEO|nr:uncharacterized protein BDR25DRAFT_357169 [Lindgomyces ingoldianus]KAF2468807.1 hypothetical protein BDR25DRAFT_357169 [Lindgomyces ingoldianus]
MFPNRSSRNRTGIYALETWTVRRVTRTGCQKAEFLVLHIHASKIFGLTRLGEEDGPRVNLHRFMSNHEAGGELCAAERPDGRYGVVSLRQWLSKQEPRPGRRGAQPEETLSPTQAKAAGPPTRFESENCERYTGCTDDIKLSLPEAIMTCTEGKRSRKSLKQNGKMPGTPDMAEYAAVGEELTMMFLLTIVPTPDFVPSPQRFRPPGEALRSLDQPPTSWLLTLTDLAIEHLFHSFSHSLKLSRHDSEAEHLHLGSSWPWSRFCRIWQVEWSSEERSC